MRVLVTGGSGYIGTAVVTHLLSTGHTVRVFETQIFGNPIAHLESNRCEFVQGDIRDQSDLKSAMINMDAVIHLAGVVTDELVDMNPDFGHSVNVDGTRNVTQLARDSWSVQRLLYASSSSVYGTAAETGIPDETVEPLPKTVYARQKLDGELIVLEANSDKLTTTAVRQATAMGPAPRMRLDTVVNIFSKQAYFDKLITPYGGEQYRSNVYVGDAARFYEGLLMLSPSLIGGKPWNLTDENLKVGEIAKIVQDTAHQWFRQKAHEAMGSKPHSDDELAYETVRVEIKDIEDARSYRLDGSAVGRELGFSNATGIRSAVMRNFEFFTSSKLDPNDDVYYNNRRMRDVLLNA